MNTSPPFRTPDSPAILGAPSSLNRALLTKDREKTIKNRAPLAEDSSRTKMTS
jgi:hypothetical protein